MAYRQAGSHPEFPHLDRARAFGALAEGVDNKTSVKSARIAAPSSFVINVNIPLIDPR